MASPAGRSTAEPDGLSNSVYTVGKRSSSIVLISLCSSLYTASKVMAGWGGMQGDGVWCSWIAWGWMWQNVAGWGQSSTVPPCFGAFYIQPTLAVGPMGFCTICARRGWVRRAQLGWGSHILSDVCLYIKKKKDKTIHWKKKDVLIQKLCSYHRAWAEKGGRKRFHLNSCIVLLWQLEFEK